MAKKKEKITDLEAMVLAGMFAKTNSGCEEPSQRDVDRAKAMRHPSVENAVTTFVASICESDEMLDMFVEEGKSWYKTFRKMSRAQVAKDWPKQAKLVWPEG